MLLLTVNYIRHMLMLILRVGQSSSLRVCYLTGSLLACFICVILCDSASAITYLISYTVYFIRFIVCKHVTEVARCIVLELGIDAKEAVELLQLVRSSSKERDSDVTALDLLHGTQSQQPIVSFSEELDTLLGGGVPLGKMTEFCGAPGVGKTQLW